MKYVAIDVGGTFIKHALMDEYGYIFRQGKEPTPLTTQTDFLDCIQSIVCEYDESINGVAISLPGTIDASNGFVFQGGTLRFNAMSNVKQLLEERVQVPVEIENDAHCAALAELWMGNLQGVQNGMVFTFGTGIGGCLILEGKPYKGTHLFAGEVSILLTKDHKEHGMNAIWGPQGSFTKFIKRVCDEKKVELMDGKTLFQWIEDKDPISSAMFQTYCDDIVRQFFNFQMLFDPQTICIGGGASANPYYIKAIQDAMNNLYDMIPVAIPHLEIVPCKFHNDSNMIGALYNFKKQQHLI